MADISRRLKPEELTIGMKVSAEQLSGIFDTYMIVLCKDGASDEGTLVYASPVQTSDYDDWFDQDEPIIPIYNSKAELEDMVVYDE